MKRGTNIQHGQKRPRPYSAALPSFLATFFGTFLLVGLAALSITGL